jgi:hypothetical protein
MNRQHFTILFAIFSVGMILVFAGGCKSEPEGPVRGTYVDADHKFSATITADNIKVYITHDHEKALYWDGTWETGETVTSDANKEALDASLFGSQSDSNMFTIDDGNV